MMLTGLDQKLPGMKVNHKFSIDVKNVNSYQNSFEILIKDLTRWKKEGYRVILLSASRTRPADWPATCGSTACAYCPDGAEPEMETGDGRGQRTPIQR